MNFRLLLRLALLVLLAAPASLLRAAPSDEDDEDIDYLGYYSNSRDKITFGYHLRQGPSVRFGNLGNVQPALANTLSTTTPLANGTTLTISQTAYRYTDGTVTTDTLRPGEMGADGKQTSTPGGRFTTTGPDINGNPITTGSYLAYTPGLTRYWGYTSPSQVTSDGSHVVFSQYTAVSDGASFEGKRKLSSGVELELKRRLNPIQARFGISLVAGINFNNISSKQAGSVSSSLMVQRDVYGTAGGAAVPLPSVGTTPSSPSYVPFPQGDGTTNPLGYETTVPIDLGSLVSGTPTSAGKTPVNGIWRVNGAYYAVRVGPQITARLTKNLEVNAGLGLMEAYVGDNYSVDEDFTVTIGGNPVDVASHDTGKTSKFLTGFYANVDAGWDANERTGFYAGLDYQSLGSYDQHVGGRTARVDLGGTVGIRGGLSIKF